MKAHLDIGLVETMRAESGAIDLLDTHLERLEESARALGFSCSLIDVRNRVEERLRDHPEDAYRVRLVLDRNGRPDVSCAPLDDKVFKTVILYPRVVAQAGDLVSTCKTTERSHYAAPRRWANENGADEAILINPRGQIFDATRTSVWVERDELLFTPPLDAGGLPGVMRRHLLDTKENTREKMLRREDLETAEAVYLSNAVRGLMPVRMVSCEPSLPEPTMSSLLETITSTLAGPQMQELAQAIGADEGSTQTAVATALPALLTAMTRNTKQPGGASALAGALQQDHDGSLLDNLSGFLSGAVTGRQADGAGILNHVLGSDQVEVEEGVAKSSGLDFSQVAKLLPLLAPIVMAVLGKQKRSAGLDPTGLSELLGKEAKTARQTVPSDLLGTLGSFFDRDGDGDYREELIETGSNILGRLFR